MQDQNDISSFDGSEYSCLKAHLGHQIEVAVYGDQNVSIECLDCCEVLYSVEKTTRLERIQEEVDDEYEAYKRAVCAMPSEAVFQQSYYIHLAEQVTYLIRECPHEIEGEEPLTTFLESLCAKKKFLVEFLAWATNNDYVDVADVSRAAESLRDFCAARMEKNNLE